MVALLVLAASSLLAAYILAGYPLLLKYRAGPFAPPVQKDLTFQPPVTLILVVYNGEAFVRAKLESILGLDYPAELLQIFLVSDGSTDQTESIASAFPRVQIIRCPHRGKAEAINAGLLQATGDILFFTDVRQPLQPDALRHLVANFADPTVGVVSGEMRLSKAGSGEQRDMDRYWRYELWVRREHSRIYSLFSATGCIYAMRRALARPLPADTLSDDCMLPLGAFFSGYRIVFEPQAIAIDQPTPTGWEFRRRWRTLAGLLQTHARYPALFTAANPMRAHFLPHKLGRLMLPWLLLAAAVATWMLPPSAFRTAILAALALPPICALINIFIPEGSSLKRLTSPAATFFLMNVAAMAAIVVFFVPARRLWKPTSVAVPRREHTR